MLKPKEFYNFYRILNWKGKVSGMRMIGYVIFGYLMAAKFSFLPLFLNILAMAGTLAFWYSLNDYFDWKIQKEKNFLATKIQKDKFTPRKALIYCFLPLVFLLPLIFIVNQINFLSLLFFLLVFILITFYSIPPLRLKQKKFWGFITPPLGATIIFLQGYSILGLLSLDILLLAIIILLFHCYLETLHIISDFFDLKEIKKVKFKRALKLRWQFPLISLATSLVFTFFNPVFLITTLFSAIRINVVRKIKIKDILKIRANLFSPLLSLYEFGIYGILGTIHLF